MKTGAPDKNRNNDMRSGAPKRKKKKKYTFDMYCRLTLCTCLKLGPAFQRCGLFVLGNFI
jgi:hypothetical protein